MSQKKNLVIVLLLAWNLWSQFNSNRNSTTSSIVGSSSSIVQDAVTLATTNSQQQQQFDPSPLSSIPDFELADLFRTEHERIDSEPHTQRCKRYGFTFDPNKSVPRRVFVGLPIADDNMETVVMQAVENYNIFHTIVFSESNRTQDGTPRTMRYNVGSPAWTQLTQTNLFGADTNVVVDYWLEGNDWTGANGFDVQGSHRNSIVPNFKAAGMRRNDVALIADVDEVVSRDFVRAIQYCVIPQWQNISDSCDKPKIITAAINFEGSPHCITKNLGFHPDFCLGACVEHIGDQTGRIVPERSYRREYGQRAPGYGSAYNGAGGKYFDKVLPFGRYPLFSGQDFRAVAGSAGLSNYMEMDGQGKTHQYGTSFHIHNFFNDLEVVRNKYLTYGESQHHKGHLKQDFICMLSNLKFTCECYRKMETFNGFLTPYEEIGGPKPIYFLNTTYRKLRHQRMGEMIIADEKAYGTPHPDIPINLD